MCKSFQKQILAKDVIILLLVVALGWSVDFHGASKVIWCVAFALNIIGVALDVTGLYNGKE